MTKNQIEFNKLLETQRANRRQEELTALRDSNTYAIGLGTLRETERANRAKEGYNLSYLDELSRANQAKELLSYGTLRETLRSNKAREAELSRSNLARETETIRANIAAEQLRLNELYERIRSNKASESIAGSNISLGYAQLAEAQRSNLARETETQRSNMAREEEIHRSNVAHEVDVDQQRSNQRSIDLAKLGQQSRQIDLYEDRLDLDRSALNQRAFFEGGRLATDVLGVIPRYIRLF